MLPIVSAVLTNKLTGKSYALGAEPFVLVLEIAGSRFRAAAGDSLLVETENVSPALLRLRYDEVGGKEASPSSSTTSSANSPGMCASA